MNEVTISAYENDDGKKRNQAKLFAAEWSRRTFKQNDKEVRSQTSLPSYPNAKRNLKIIPEKNDS